MAFKSAFGSSGSGVTSFFGTPSKSSHHSLLGNLLTDAIDTAKGIPEGMVQFAEHPIRSSKLAVKQTGRTYSPLVHGHFGQFYHEFHAHPLQPLLDAISIPALAAGGLGAGIKGASALTDIGRVAELESLGRGAEVASAGKLTPELSRAPRLARAAEHFQPGTKFTTKTVPTKIAGYDEVKAYSTNLFSRALQRGAGGIFEKAGSVKVGGRSLPLIGEGKALDATPVGQGQRLLAKTRSRRAASTNAAVKSEVLAGVKAARKGASRGEIERALTTRMDEVFHQELIPLSAEKAQNLDPRGHFGYLPDRDPTPIALKSTSPEDIVDFAKGLGGRNKPVYKVSKAYKNDKGQVLMFRQAAPEMIKNEIEGTAGLAKAIHANPTKVWKALILAQAPRYFVNNVVGNAGMLAAATHPVALTRGILDSIRSVRGIKAAEAAQREMGRTAVAEVRKYMPDEIVSQRFPFLYHSPLGLDQHALLPKPKLHTSRIATGFYGITDKVAYRATQRAGLMAALRAQKSVRDLEKLYRARGWNRYKAFQEAARKATEDPKVMSAVEKQVTDWAGQYYHLNGFERMITAIVPFYNWDRHALRFAKTQVLDRPFQSAVMARLGSQGNEATDKALGKIPDFLKGAVPVHGANGGVWGFVLGGELPGRKKVILTAGLNPMAAASEDVHALAALVGAHSPGEAVGGQLNPLISGAISGVTGQRLFSGAKVHHHGGVIGSALTETFGELPQANLIRTLIEGVPKPKPNKQTGKTKPFLYTKDVRQQLSSLLGLPEREFSPESAKALYDKQHGIKKGRRHARKMASSFKSAF